MATTEAVQQRADRATELIERLNRVPLTRFHWQLVGLSGLGWMFDAMDILLLASVLAAFGREYALDTWTINVIASINLLGMFVGAAFAGALADRVGRKVLFQATLLIYSVFTGLSALAFSAATLAVLRFLAGVGLGGELPVASTLVSELAPASRRGLLVVLLESFWAFGAVLAALIGFLVIPTFNWRVAFLIGALPALYVFVLRRRIPESPRYLLSQGRLLEAERVVNRIERSAGIETPSSRWEGQDKRLSHGPGSPKRPGWRREELQRFRPPAVSLRDLFGRVYLRRTLVLWVLWATLNFSYYGIFLWLPSQFVRKGFSLEQALLFNLIVAVAQIPGYFSAAWLVERVGRKPTLVAYLVGAAAGAYLFSLATLPEQLGPEAIPSILIWGSVMAFFNLGAWGVVYAYTPELYPTEVRGTGTGAATGFGRIFAMLAPLSIGLQLALFGSNANVFLAFVVVMLVGAVVMLLLGIETRGRSLEELAVAPA